MAKKKTKKKATKKKAAKKKAAKRKPRKSKKPKVSAEDVIVDQIVAMIEEDNLLPWHKPWSHVGILPTNLQSMKEYRGANILFLSFYAHRYDGCPFWLTWKQAREVAERQAKKKGIDIEDGEWRGGVKKEEAKNGYPIVFWGSADKKKDGKVVKDAKGNPEKVRFLRYYRVFNVEQCDGIEWPRPPVPTAFARIEACEGIVAGMPAPPSIKHGASGAFYSPSEDLVALPNQTTFHSPEEYYSTMFHELAHSTGHKGRLARKSLMDTTYFGSHSYSHEELVAEMASVFVCARAGIDSTLNNSAAYLKHWLGQIKEDPRILITSAQAAQKASDWVMNTRYEKKKEEAA